MQSNILTLPKILIYIPIWKRPEITEICFSGLDRIRTHRDRVEILAVISENDYKPRCKRHDVEYTFFENRLGAKKNHGLKVALTKDWDYLIELNSDDLIKNELLDIYDTYFGEWDFFGLRNFCFMDSKTGRMRHRQGKTIYGIGRTYSRAVIEQCYPLWDPEATAGMDNHAWKIIEDVNKIKGRQIPLTDEPLAVDIKSDTNIWAYPENSGVPYEWNDFKVGLSEREIELIDGIINSNAA